MSTSSSDNKTRWYSGYRESQEYRIVGIGALVGDIVSRKYLPSSLQYRVDYDRIRDDGKCSE